MAQTTSTSFQRIANGEYGEGETTEYRNSMGETLAYVDYTADRTQAWVTVFNPYRAGERRYSRRPAAAAEAIAHRHIEKY
jgi:hypothetical protein